MGVDKPTVSRRIAPQNDFVPIPPEQTWRSVPWHFEEQVRRSANRIAVKTSDTSLTYEELNLIANRLAHAILDRCGEDEKLVALWCDFGLPSVMGILAALKAGKFYVPLDPALPDARARDILDDSGATTVLTRKTHADRVRGIAGPSVKVLDADDICRSGYAANPGLETTPEANFALLYTSGSTGKPKGVIITHRMVLRGVRAATNHLHLCDRDRCALLFSYTYAWSLMTIFGHLLNGGTLLPYDVRSSGLRDMAGWLARERVTVMECVTSLFRDFAAAFPRQGKLPNLRILQVGGEPVYRSDFETYKRLPAPDCLFVLCLGSTEVCGATTRMPIDRTYEPDSNVLPVGYPVEGMEILIIGEDGNRMNAGEAGEVVIRSRFLTPGYWRRPEETAATFTEDPAGGGFRLQRTGDIGRLSPDGCLTLLGRKDAQVKVRGHRIELAEIENALLQIEGVTAAAAKVFTGDGPRADRLIGYIVPARGREPDATRLRAGLAARLPDYMIPSQFFTLEKLPVTSSGKLDRLSLPDPGIARATPDAQFEPPRTPIETALAEIWSETLGVTPVGVQDNFFDLGGDSLKALRLFLRIETALGSRLPPTTILDAPTVARLAALLEAGTAPTPSGILVPMRSGGSRPPLFCVHTLRGEVVSYISLAELLGDDQPVFGIRAVGLDGLEPPLHTVEEMAARYVAEVIRTRPTGPYILAGLCIGGALAYEMARQMRARNLDVPLLILLDTPCPPFSRGMRLDFLKERATHHLRLRARALFDTGLNRLMERRFSLRSRCAKSARANLVSVGTKSRAKALQDAVDRAGQRAMRTYHPGEYAGRVVHIMATKPFQKWVPDLRLGWAALVRNGVQTHLVEADHHNILSEPRVRIVAEKIEGTIRQAVCSHR